MWVRTSALVLGKMSRDHDHLAVVRAVVLCPGLWSLSIRTLALPFLTRPILE